MRHNTALDSVHVGAVWLDCHQALQVIATCPIQLHWCVDAGHSHRALALAATVQARNTLLLYLAASGRADEAPGADRAASS
jgi:hypothetical protein